MEQGGSMGLWIAYGVIGLFLVVLAAVVLRTAMLYGSLVLMSLVRRGRTHGMPAPEPPPGGHAGPDA